MQLSPTMDLGTFVRWIKRPGDAVEPDDTVAEIETDKAVMEMQAFDTGILLATLAEEGEHLPVGTPIAIIGDAGEDISDLLQEAKSKLNAIRNQTTPTVPVGSTATEPPTVSSQPASIPVSAPSQSSPIVKRIDSVTETSVTQDRPLEKVTVTVSKIGSPVIDAPSLNGLISLSPGIALARSAHRTRHPISPLARKMAESHGIDITLIHPKEGGRIKAADVEEFMQMRMSKGQVIADVPADKKVTLSNMRRVIASRLSDSKSHIPHYYLNSEFDATALIKLREEANQGFQENEVKFSINDFIVRGCALALRKHPVVNSSWRGDHILEYGRVDIGIAVALDEGLITPYVRNADRQSLRELALEIRDLAKRAKDRKLKPEEYTDGTFTVSNLGMFGIRDFSAIINEPEAAIMAVGGIFDRARVHDGQLVATKTITVTLSCDHRVVDGAEGASFLSTFQHLMEHPTMLLI